MIDWTRLRPFGEAKWRSFEELCYQLAVAEFNDLGVFTSPDDSGGGDGVEFFLTLDDGTEWGWQAKFYHPNPRLTPGRRSKIRESLQRSVERHPAIVRWFLCTPTSFTTGEDHTELRWWAKLQAEFAGVRLVHWGSSELGRLLAQTRNTGVRTHFFGDLPLEPGWFRARLDAQLANLRDPYERDLHVETEVDLRIQYMARGAAWRYGLRAAAAGAAKARDELNDSWEFIRDRESSGTLRDAARTLSAAAQSGVAMLQALATLPYMMIDQSAWHLRRAHQRVGEARDAYVWTTLGAFGPELLDDPPDGPSGPEPTLLQRMGQPAAWAVTIIQHLHLATGLYEDATRPAMHVLGAVGVGKTHTAAHACEEAIRAGRPALLFLGARFRRGEPLERQILDQIDVGGTWDEFAAALNSYAAATASPALVVIDALNEAVDPSLWRDTLPGLLQSLSRYTRIRVVTTCRPSYVPDVWGESPPNAIDARGFSAAEMPVALARYFARYRLVVDTTLVPLDQFQNPLHLKIFCEGENPERRVVKEVSLGAQTLYRVLDKYLSGVSVTVSRRLGRRPSKEFVVQALTPLCAALWASGRRKVPVDEAELLFGANPRDWENSLTRVLLDEALLIYKDLTAREGEQVGFTYDLLGGYLIARWLLRDLHRTRLPEFLASPAVSNGLAAANRAERHPLHEDILRGLAAALPDIAGAHLLSVTDDPVLREAGVRALFEMDPDRVTGVATDHVVALFSVPEHRRLLLRFGHRTALSLRHPLNARFWDGLLRSLPMRERDLALGVQVAEQVTEWEWLAREVERVCRAPRMGGPQADARLDLAAERLVWALASTARDLRDRATRALYWYGRRRPGTLAELALRAFSVDDPSIRERCVAACFGVAAAYHADPDARDYRGSVLPHLARALHAQMFADGAPHGTTHALLRDYAAGVVELAVRVHPDLFSAAELARAGASFPSPAGRGDVGSWGTRDDEEADGYWDRDAPLDRDFANYTVGRLVPGRGLYDDEHRDYQEVLGKLRWRMHDLGYQASAFRELDRRGEPFVAMPPATSPEPYIERFAKKYAMIAFHELYGWRSDRGLLPEAYAGAPGRTTEVDIDPSFPDPPHRILVMGGDPLPPASVSPHAWVEEGAIPAMAPHLIVSELDGEPGPWVLLDAVLNHDRRATGHGLLVVIRSTFTSRRDAAALARELAGVAPGHRGLPDPPQDPYSFAGEAPWRSAFRPTDLERISLSHARGGSLRTYGVIPTVRINDWERRNAETARTYRVAVVAKQVALQLNLWMRLPAWDLHEPDGRRATISGWWEKPRVNQSATWIRQDLLDRWLTTNGMGLVWDVGGERRRRVAAPGMLRDASEGPHYQGFRTIFRYMRRRVVPVKERSP